MHRYASYSYEDAVAKIRHKGPACHYFTNARKMLLSWELFINFWFFDLKLVKAQKKLLSYIWLHRSSSMLEMEET